MKQVPTTDSRKGSLSEMPSLPLPTDPGSYSTAKEQGDHFSVQTLYPWLLFASTAVAATFCLAYIMKPVIVSDPSQGSSGFVSRETKSGTAPSADTSARIIPDSSAQPGKPATASLNDTLSPSPRTSGFEETNVRVRHVFDAKSVTGAVSRITLDVPVLYQSRNLRWTQQEAAAARDLLGRLSEYQMKARGLRKEGTTLLEDWNSLLERSIPVQALRAESPSLPSNQQDRPLAPDREKATDSNQHKTKAQ